MNEEKLKRMNETEDTSMAVTGVKWGIQGQLKNKSNNNLMNEENKKD